MNEQDERRAFLAGWEAFIHQYGNLLIAHGMRDFRPGFEDEWQIYWQTRIKEVDGD